VIHGLPEIEAAWLRAFFSDPNALRWDDLVNGVVPARLADQVRPWVETLVSGYGATAIVLPFVRRGVIVGWYASPKGADGGQELGDELNAWLGPTLLQMVRQLPLAAGDPMARAMTGRFGARVWRFAGADAAGNQAIVAKVAEYCALLARRPPLARRYVRPVGSIRAEFERAVLAQDEAHAEAMIAQLRDTGRLNEENLRYLDVRLKAGLGLWPQIARDSWLISTLSDLALPPQVLSDLVEALYRTFIDEFEASVDPVAALRVFGEAVSGRYPRLFASRRGLRTPRVVKAFLLFERLQPRPNAQILFDLAALLPASDRASSFVQALSAIDTVEPPTEDDADLAFDDGQFDRAFELYIVLRPARKTASRLLSCVLSIGTPDTRQRFRAWIDGAGDGFLASLPLAMREKIDSLYTADQSAVAPAVDLDPWMNWARRLKSGENLAAAELAVRDGATTWDASSYLTSEPRSQELADLLVNLQGEPAEILRRSFAKIFAAFFPEGAAPERSTRPIANMLFLLLALDDALSATDLVLLEQLLTRLLSLGLSEADYVSLVGDLAEVQGRIASYTHLAWSLDVCEALAVAPCPSAASREARLRFFLNVLGQAPGFGHRLLTPELLVIEYLAKDFGVDAEAMTSLRRASEALGADSTGPDLSGKTIGIYTLAEAAGLRAKQLLETLYPGCDVQLNSDLVCTSTLTSLAQASDVFVFAWKSSSHQAYYCVKAALTKCELIYAAGKGTASIMAAVREAIE
jgi:hypothetical protein